MAKKRQRNEISKKDRKHLIEFGEQHPADLESERIKRATKEAKLTGTFKRKTITAKLPQHLQHLKNDKRRKVEDKEKEEVEEDDESDSEEEEQNYTKADLMELIKRETADEIKQLDDEVNNQADGELINESDDDEIPATNTWLEHIEGDGVELEVKKPEKVTLPFHLNSTQTGTSFDVFDKIDELHIKKRLQRNIRPNWEQREKEVFCALHQYKDVLMTRSTKKTLSSYVLHALNHIMKSNTHVNNNNQALIQMTDEEKQAADIRDRQLMRPKVLILLPYRSNAKQVVDEIIRLITPPSGKMEVSYRKRFEKEYGSSVEVEKAKKEKNRPADFKRIFSGNTDECFRIGVSFLTKAVRLYAPFYSSDIIIASPLGLRKIIGTEDDSRKEYDFMSSIEMCIVDHADYIMMQNWMHLNHVMAHLNLQPKEAHDCDFSRVRLWAAEGKAKLYRQTIVLSHSEHDLIEALIKQHGHNYRGRVELRGPHGASQLGHITTPVPQLFHRLNGATREARFTARMNAFKKMIHDVVKAKLTHILVYVPCYFEYIKIRNFMNDTSVKFVSVTEYSEPSEVRRCRKFFEEGEYPIMLLTERRHFYHRVVQRHVKRLIMVRPPQFGHFYAELVNFIVTPTNSDVCLFYTKDDRAQLEAIVGKGEAKRLLKDDKPVHCFIAQ